MQARCREGRARAACTTAFVAGALANDGSDADRLIALRFVAGLWLTERGSALLAALRGWAALLATIDVRTLSTPLIEATLAALATHLGVCPRSARAWRTTQRQGFTHRCSSLFMGAYRCSTLTLLIVIQKAAQPARRCCCEAHVLPRPVNACLCHRQR